MLRFWWLVCCAGWSLADVQLITVHTELDIEGAHALAGAIAFQVEGSDFTAVSAAEPYYLRITLDHNAFLADTLVDQASADPLLSLPINLAMRADGVGVRAVAAPDAVRIVRWVAGEPSIWIEVRQSSDGWLNDNGTVTGPGPGKSAEFILGISARISDLNWDADAADDGANLPFNTRASSAAEGQYALAVSSLLCVDLTDSTLMAEGFPPTSILGFDIIAFDHAAAQGGGIYSGSTGNDTGINFTNDFTVGWGNQHICDGYENPGTTAATMPEMGLKTLQHVYETGFDCAVGSSILTTDLVSGSIFHLEVTTPDVGFPAEDAAAFTGYSGDVVVDETSAVTVGGVTLYTAVDLVYTDAALSLSNYVALDTRLRLWYLPGAAAPIDVHQTVYLAGHDGAADTAPYTGPEQNRRCAPDFFELNGFLQEITPPGPWDCLGAWPGITVLDLVTLGVPCP